MPNAGDTYVITLNQAHLEWGTHRHTNSRGIIYGEGYIPIPSHIARSFGIYNSNYHLNGLGINLFNCTSADGFFAGLLKSGGCCEAGDVYAKQFHGDGNLRALGYWFTHCNAQVGDHIEVTWTSPTDIIIRHF